jgi:hypothetical protein
MHKNATKCNKTLRKWCKHKHGASKIIDTFETYHTPKSSLAPLFAVLQSKRASTFGSLVFSSTGSINLGFTTEGKLAAVLIITLLLGFSNKFSAVNYTLAKQQSDLDTEKDFKEDFVLFPGKSVARGDMSQTYL